MLLGLGGLARTGKGSCLTPGSTEQLFFGILGLTTGAMAMTVVCLSPSAFRGGLVGMLSTVRVDDFGLRGVWIEELGSCDISFSSVLSMPSSTGMDSVWVSMGASFAKLHCLEFFSALGISQLSVRRLEPSCMRLVATTAFMAA